MYLLNPYIIEKSGLSVFASHPNEKIKKIESDKVIQLDNISEFVKKELDRLKNEELNYPDRFYNAYSLHDINYKTQNENYDYTKPFGYIIFNTGRMEPYYIKYEIYFKTMFIE